jgi:hypothetical protein
MTKNEITFQRKIKKKELDLGFLYIPAQARDYFPSTNSAISFSAEGVSDAEQTYNSDHNRLFGLTAFYKKHQLSLDDLVQVEVNKKGIYISIPKKAIIEDEEEIEEDDIIDFSGLSSVAKGNIAEDRIKEIILLNSGGLLGVYRPVSDTRGIDLIVMKEDQFHTIFLQVKSRFQVNQKDQLILTVKKSSFKIHPSNYLVGISFEPETAEIGENILLMPSKEVAKLATTVVNKGQEYYRINVKYSKAKASKFKKYFMSKKELVDQLLDKLDLTL